MKRPETAALFLSLLLLLPGCTTVLPNGSDASDRGTAARTEASKPTDPTRYTDPQLLSLCREIGESGFSVGMAFLGFADEKAVESDLRSNLKSSRYAEKYAFLADAPFVDAGGTELYAVVAAGEECRVSVYRAALSGSGAYDVQTDETLYAKDGTGCILLRCNVSDIHANAVISLQTGDTVLSMFPMLSGADGRLVAEGCYDFSVYTDGEAEENRHVRIARELLIEAKSVQEHMIQGMTLLYTGEHQTIEGRDCRIFALGTEHDGQFVREYLYGVCDNLIYIYDVPNDTWRILGTE